MKRSQIYLKAHRRLNLLDFLRLDGSLDWCGGGLEVGGLVLELTWKKKIGQFAKEYGSINNLFDVLKTFN